MTETMCVKPTTTPIPNPPVSIRAGEDVEKLGVKLNPEFELHGEGTIIAGNACC